MNKTIEYVNKTKQDAMKLIRDAQKDMAMLEEDIALLEMIVEESDRDIKEASRPMYGKCRLLVMAIIAVILLGIAASGCQTLQGVKGDIHWMTADVEHSQQ